MCESVRCVHILYGYQLLTSSICYYYIILFNFIFVCYILMEGVWPESKSFSDERMGQVPPKWQGICQNDTHFGVKCNRNFAGSYLLPSLFSIFLFILGNGQHT